ncbi:MAG: hypothetical protein IKF14_13320 [Atopobiaceae bacterium]|nr:hypothetical protein [Atopobiaceae bacterium]
MFILMQAQHERGTNEIGTALIGKYASYKEAHNAMEKLLRNRQGKHDPSEWSYVDDFEMKHEDEFGNWWHWFVIDTDDPREFFIEGGDDLFYDD